MARAGFKPSNRLERVGYEVAPPTPDERDVAADVENALREEHRARVQTFDDQVRRIQDVRRDTTAQLRRLLGEGPLQELRGTVADIRRERTSSRPARAGAGESDTKRAHRSRIAAVLKDSDIESDSIVRLRDARRETLAGILGQRESEPESALRQVSVNEVPAEVLNHTSNPYSIRKPPYDSWWESTYRYMDDGWMDLKTYHDPQGGLVGHRSDYINNDAGEQLSVNYEIDDWLSLKTSNSVGFWYNPPKAGAIDLWFKARYYAAVSSEFWVDDAWGIHENDADMWSNAYVAVDTFQDAAEEVRAKVLWHHIVTSPDDPATYKVALHQAGKELWWHLTSKPVAANKWIFVRVGTYDERTALLDDVDTKQYMRHRFYVDEIQYKVV